MSDTPETDAAIKAQAEWRRPFISTTFDGITYDSPVASLCRKLERERDEARAVAYDLAAIASHCLGWHDHESAKAADRITSVLKKWKELKQ